MNVTIQFTGAVTPKTQASQLRDIAGIVEKYGAVVSATTTDGESEETSSHDMSTIRSKLAEETTTPKRRGRPPGRRSLQGDEDTTDEGTERERKAARKTAGKEDAKPDTVEEDDAEETEDEGEFSLGAEDEEDTGPSLDEVRKALRKFADKHDDKSKSYAILKKFGAKSPDTLDKKHYAAVVKAARI